MNHPAIDSGVPPATSWGARIGNRSGRETCATVDSAKFDLFDERDQTRPQRVEASR
jgi:hypothetical protein